MLVKPNENYRQAGVIGGVELNKNTIYDAEIASNLPEYEEKGKVFVEGIMLTNDEYAIVKEE